MLSSRNNVMTIVSVLFLLCGLQHVCLASSESFDILENEDYFEGDLFIPELMSAAKDRLNTLSSVMALRKNKQWPKAVMPYKISVTHSSAVNVIKSAMKEWEQKTCVKFVTRTTQKNFVEFITGGGGCWSNGVGMNGNGKQRINLDGGCWHHGIVVHEIGHALGFWHEQSRWDRDDFVRIVWDNIKAGLESQFKKYTRQQIDSLGVPYDYDSIMHYSRKAFTKNNLDTIVPKKPGAGIGQRSGLSKLDALQANLLYKCLSTTVTPTTETRPTQKFVASIIHLQSRKCLFPLGGRVLGENHPVIASSNCTAKESQFVFLADSGNIQHVSSGMCLHPTGSCTHPEENTEVVLSKTCGTHEEEFMLLENGVFEHSLSGTCVRPASGVTDVVDGTRFVIHSICDANKYAFGYSFAPPKSRNLALGKPTIQSSTSHQGYSRNAVDGNRNGDYSKGSCTHTYRSKTPWWRVDLLKKYKVAMVYVSNRADCCWERLYMQVSVGDSTTNAGRDNPVCGEKLGVGRGQTVVILCNPILTGRYVTIFMYSKYSTPLTLCEVEIYEDPGSRRIPTTGPSPGIQGVIQHSSSKLCLSPKYKTITSGTPVVLDLSCFKPSARFRVLSDGSLKHVTSAMCLSPKDGCKNSAQDAELVLVDKCQTKETAFEFTDGGVLMHVMSKTCVRPSSEPVSNGGTTMVVLNKECDAKKHEFQLITAPPSPPTSLPVTGDCGHVLVKSTLVIGGVDAKPGAWPWQVALHRQGRFICGGSLIKKDWVLTAAHCISTSVRPDLYTVVLGDHDRNKNENTEVEIKVKKYFRHPNYYKPYPINNDVALLQLESPAQMTSFINTVCLPPQNYQLPTAGSTCFITGWGKIRHPGSSHPILQQANLPPVTNKVCHEKLKKSPGSSSLTITENMLCAGKENTNLSGCHGDSGGPYVCKHDNNRWYLQGAVSWGSSSCSASQRYTVFARIAKFNKWIEDITKVNAR